MGNYSNFSKLLKQHLEDQERTPTWLATKIHVRQQTVSKWVLDGNRPGSAELVNQIVDVLRLNVDEHKALLVAADYAAYYAVDLPTNAPSGNTSPMPQGYTSQRLSSDSHEPPPKFSINKGDFLPTEGKSSGEFTTVFQEAQKKNLTPVWGVMFIGLILGIAITITLMASLTARETVARMVSPIVETMRQLFGERSEPSPQPDPTMTPRPVPTTTPLPSATLTPTVIPMSTPTLNGTEEAGIRATDIAVAATQTALVTTTPDIPTVDDLSGNTATPIPTTPTPTSEYPCEAEIVSPRGIWPLPISFRNVPNGTDSDSREYQPGDKIIIQRPSADGRWYEIAELDGGVLGWADPEYFTDCIQISQ